MAYKAAVYGSGIQFRLRGGHLLRDVGVIVTLVVVVAAFVQAIR